MFGAGGGTSSYEEIEHTDLIVLWGSNARETHPIFFHHVLKGIRNGAKLIVVDPRRTSSAEWADLWLGIDVGSDIALSNTVAREIVANDLHNAAFIARGTEGFEAYRESLAEWTLERGERETGVPADAIRELAHAYARADRAVICWTLGITEHHNAVDNVLALINLGLLTGHVGRYGSGLNPLRGQNNVQGGGDMGAIPNKLPGFQDIETDMVARQKFESRWEAPILPTARMAPVGDVRRDGARRAHRGVLRRREPRELGGRRPPDAIAAGGARHAHRAGHVHDEDRRARRRRPAGGQLHVRVGRHRHEQRAARPARAQGARAAGQRPGRHLDHRAARQAPRPGLGRPHAGRRVGGAPPAVADARRDVVEAPRGAGGDPVAVPLGGPPGHAYLHARLWEEDPHRRGTPAPFSVVVHEPPVDELTEEFPLRLTTGRRLDSYNTGVQSGGYSSPMRRGETIDLSPEDAERLGVADGEVVRVTSRRGSVEAPARVDRGLRPGLAFMTLHFPDQVETNVLTIDATDPKSGTAEFKASAVRVERLDPAVAAGPGA